MKPFLGLILFFTLSLGTNLAFSGDCSDLNALIEKNKNNEKKLLELNNKYPRCGEIHYALGKYYYKRNVWKAAFRHCSKAEKYFPDNSELAEKIVEIKWKLPVTIENEKQLEEEALKIAERNVAGIAPLPAPVDFKTLFDFDSAELKPEHKKYIDRFAKALMTGEKEYRIVLQGHTDNIGTEEYNRELSIKRAQAVKNYMVKVHGYPAELLKVEGYGSKDPIDTNETEIGRSHNRRVRFKD